MTTMPMNTGRSAMSPPQSGITSSLVNSRIEFQMFWRSSMGPESLLAGRTGDEDVEHQAHRDAEDRQHRRPGVVEVEVAEVGEGPVGRARDDEDDADEGRVARVPERMH